MKAAAFTDVLDIYEGMITGVVPEFVFIMGLLWNERAGRASSTEDREFPEHTDLGGEA